MIELLCPVCRTSLLQVPHAFECKKCNVSYPVKDGIPSLSSTSSYFFGEISEQEINQCIEKAEKEGWLKALNDYVRPLSPDTYQYATDYSRVDWRFLLPLTKETRVLDWGCGWGIISLALAHSCGHVVAMDETFQKIKFLHIRSQQEKIDNIDFVHAGDLLELPFADAEFDVIVMNGVLEWTGVSSHEKNPFIAQKKALKSAYRCLKKNGVLYLAIENRFGYNYFLGAQDHNGLCFVGLMPRRLADLYCRLAGKERYKTPIHSYMTYKKYLRETGFAQSIFYFPVPNYQYPSFILPLEKLYLHKYFIRYLFPVEKKKVIYSILKFVAAIIVDLNIMHYFTPAYAIVAKKSVNIQ